MNKKTITNLEELKDFLIQLKEQQTNKWKNIVSELKINNDDTKLKEEKILIEKAGKKSKLGLDFLDNKIGIGELPDDAIKVIIKLIFK